MQNNNLQNMFEDIQPYKQYGGKFPILNPEYKDKQYILYFQKLKTLIKKQQYTSRSNQLANLIIQKLSSNYNAWYVKRMCLQNHSIDLQQQLIYTKEYLPQNIKTFQGWEYRRVLIQKKAPTDFENELDFIEEVLQQDSKNYHLWTYRLWLTEKYNLYQIEKVRLQKWIEQDVMNNSAWSYRHFLFQSKKISNQQFKKQIQYIKQKILLKKDNDAAWNYLRGWFPSIKLKQIPCKKIEQTKSQIFQYSQFPEVQEFVVEFVKQNPQLINGYVTLVNIYSQNQKQVQFAKAICEVLVTKQSQKQFYWRWVQNNI